MIMKRLFLENEFGIEVPRYAYTLQCDWHFIALIRPESFERGSVMLEGLGIGHSPSTKAPLIKQPNIMPSHSCFPYKQYIPGP